MNKSKVSGFTPILVIILVFLVLAVAGAYYLGTRKGQVPLQSPTPSPSSKSTAKDERGKYILGEVLVTFNDGVTYKQAKDLFQSKDIASYENTYWKAQAKLTSESYVLSRVDLFKIKVSPGLEGDVIQDLSSSSIVRNAGKNYLYNLP